MAIWVSTQRSSKDRLSPDQLTRLNALGFSWDPFSEQWENGFEALKEFHQRNGHCLVAQKQKEDGGFLGAWVSYQRAKKDRLTPDQLNRLNALGFSWDPIAEQWEEGFAALQKFHQREGHCFVPRSHQEDGVRLAIWVGTQRIIKDRLSSDQLSRLNALGFSWDPRAEQWEEAFAALQKFHQREGHCRVSQTHEEGRVQLGAWVSKQRDRRDTLSPDRLARLNALGFSWDPRTEQWEKAFAALETFHAREGHARVVRGTREGGFALGSWVLKQRHRKASLTSDQLNRLNALGFSWDPFAEQWEEGFAALQKFHKREGHCRVPRGNDEFGLNLGGWVSLQRSRKKGLTPEQIKRLDTLGFSWDPLAEQWEEGFAALVQFKKSNGHVRVVAQHRENGLNLGVWVTTQRSKKDSLTPDRLKRLNALGFAWKIRNL